MKNIIFLLCFLFPIVSGAQGVQFQGTPTTKIINKGAYVIDSILRIPVRDTVSWLNEWGNLTIRPQDNKLYVRRSGNWGSVSTSNSGSQTALVAADTNFLLATKSNLRDSSAGLRAAINTRFKTSNLVLSMLGYTNNDTTVATTGALAQYIQVDVHPYMYYAYDRTIDSLDVYGTSTKYIKLYRHSLPALLDSFQDNNTTYTPGWGLLLTGTQFRVDTTQVATQHDLDSVAALTAYTGVFPIVINPVTHQVSLAPSGVIPSTFTKVTVNAQGIVTSGTALDPGDIPNIEQSQVNGLVDTVTAHRNRIAVNRQAIIDSTGNLRNYTNAQLGLKENIANRLLSMIGATTTDTTYVTSNALAEYAQLTIYPQLYYAYDRAIDSIRVTGDAVKHVTLYRRDGLSYVDSFVDNNTVFDSTGVYNLLAQKLDKADSLTGYATQYDNSLKQDIANITDDALTNPNSIEYPSTKAVSDAIDTALSVAANTYIPLSSLGQPGGPPPLDPGGKIDFIYLPASLMIYKGVWSPVTNTPTLVNGTGTAGWVYKASWVGGADSAVINLGGGNLTFYKGDFVLYNGTAWERSVGTDNVVSVNGKQGIVLLRIQDIPGLQDSLNAKEPVFTKGNLVAGTNVTLGGTLTGRLVGSGNITVNASVPAGYVQFSDTLITIATKKNLRDTAAQIRSSLSAYELQSNKVNNFNTVNGVLYPSVQAIVNSFLNGTFTAGQVKIINNANLFDMSPANNSRTWHDVFAFGNRLTLWETTTDYGTNWTTGAANLGLFNQKQADPTNVSTLTNTAGVLNGIRMRWNGFAFGQLQWVLMQVNFTGPNCFYNVTMEESADNVNWTVLGNPYPTVQIPGATTAAFRFPQNTATYNRLTIVLNSASSPAGATAAIKNVNGLALRAGDQGYGRETEYPYSWNNSKHMIFTTPAWVPPSGSTPIPTNYRVAVLDSTATGKTLTSTTLAYLLQGITLAPSGAAGGDLSGTYPNPTVAKFNGQLPTYYLARANHTGTQAQSTINNLQDSLNLKVSLNNGPNYTNITGDSWSLYGIDNIGVGVTLINPGMAFYLKTNITSGFAKLYTNLLTANRDYRFPNDSGTLALTSQLTGGPGYIQNQEDSAQVANAWISGKFKSSAFAGPSDNYLLPQSDHWRVATSGGSPSLLKTGGLVIADDWLSPPSDYGLYVQETAQFDGSVGIGTPLPAQALHVVGRIRQTAVTSSMLKANAAGDLVAAVSGTDYGTVTSFSAGDLSPLFTTTEATVTTSPALSFALSNAGANTWFGNATGSGAAPVYNSLGALTKTDDANITLTLGGTPATALNKAVSITAGWTGQLSVARGGTGLSALGTANQLIRVNSGATALEYFTPSYLTGNQSITWTGTGDVTGSASGTTSISPALTIAANTVSNTKLADMATQTFKGRTTAGTGDPEDLSIAQAKSILNLTGTNSGDQTITLTGDVTGSGTGSFATAIAAGVIVNADINASAAIAHSKIAALTAGRAMVTDGSGFASAATTTATEIGYVNGVTSSIQTQLNGKAATTGAAGYIQNQYVGAQTADAWITGNIKANGFAGPNNNLLWPQTDSWWVSANDGTPGKLKAGGMSISDDWDEPPSDYGLYVKDRVFIGGYAPMNDNGSTIFSVQSPGSSASSMILGSPANTQMGLVGDNGQYGLFFGMNTTTGNQWIQAGRVDGTPIAYDLSLQASGGNVGIGTASPTALLDVAGTAKVETLGIGVDPTEALDVQGSIKQSAVIGQMVKADDVGTLVPATSGVDYVAPSSLSSGTYTPTIAFTTGSFTPDGFRYTRVGNNVTVYGRIIANPGIDYTGTISLPITSNLASASDLIGVVSGQGLTASPNLIKGDGAGDTALLTFAPSAGTATIYVSFMYTIQ